jgi:tetratricopeptide (TPR) repeat protein
MYGHDLEELLEEIAEDRQEKIAFYENLLKKEPNNAEYHWRLGNYYGVEPGMDQKSFEHHKKAVELDSSVAPYHRSLSSDYIYQEKLDLALKEAETAYNIDPKDKNNYNALYSVYHSKKEWDSVIKLGEKQLTLTTDKSFIESIERDLSYAREMKSLR